MIKYHIYKDSGIPRARFPDKEYQAFGDWLEGDIQKNLYNLNKVMNYIGDIKNSKIDKAKFGGNDMLLKIDSSGAYVQSLLAFDEDLNAEDYPPSAKISLKELEKILSDWKDVISTDLK